jgi:hypothetical protein
MEALRQIETAQGIARGAAICSGRCVIGPPIENQSKHGRAGPSLPASPAVTQAPP